jgi:hypothetical protein
MKVVSRHVLIDNSPPFWVTVALDEILESIEEVRWPPNSDSFLIYPERGKKRGEGNGVRPIKESFVENLLARGWTPEHPFPLRIENSASQLGAMDAGKVFGDDGDFCAVEWETGNISSSHRALNKLSLGLIKESICLGVLVVPTVELARYLTDRVGNLRELVPYFYLWSTLKVPKGYLEIIAVQQDGESTSVPKIPKGTDGRSIN